MNRDLVLFKGTKEGIHIIVNDHNASFEEILEELNHKLKNNQRFFAGGNVMVDQGLKALDACQKQRIASLLADEYGLGTVGFKDTEDEAKKDAVSALPTLFVERTVRSGQEINFAGHVVIIGDINSGGQVRAVGTICVLGAVRGMAHAGVEGDRTAFVAGYSFSTPNVQVRIADLIVRGPEDDTPSGPGPEIARVQDGQIIVYNVTRSDYF